MISFTALKKHADGFIKRIDTEYYIQPMETNSTYLHIPGFLSAAQLNQVEQLSQQAPFEDGRKTASLAAKEVKHNLQIDPTSQQYMALQQIMFEAINQSVLLRNVTFPRQVHPFLFSKYGPGMAYGWHVDSPVMGNMIRTDIAITVFLSEPGEYEGGELELQTAAGISLYKYEKGDAICYPCTQLHRVREVTKGERKVAISWIQSMVRHAEQRKILFEINGVVETLRGKELQSEEANLLLQTHSNLLRMWSEN
jgi:PKHD-type hydroxylase